ncbi:MAG: asparagine synthase (glutamine-hydrolyzing) [Bacteroidota bacterium]|nr:asparagine synthase (glutamine-hydrolyzing) [Bacteroidota bacterium]
MCGFAGIFCFHSASPSITPEILKRMGDTIVHRGPDDEGTFIAPHGALGFAFRRLSIIDLSPAGHQPMGTPDGSVWISFNGEIYNHRILRAELEKHGFTYRSRTDTETILYAYKRWGERFVDRLEGMFAIALWDRDSDTLLLYRDRLGIKPLYYAECQGSLLFGSEIKAILAHPSMEARLSKEAFFHYLTYIHTPAPLTLFEGIRKLEPGCYLRISRAGRMERIRYWDIVSPPQEGFDYTDETAVAERLRELFLRAVEKRMMADVPFGVFLSGGIDSSANVAFMARLMDRPVDTFTVAVKGQEDTNEFMWARRISRLFGTSHHEILIDDHGFLDLLPTIVHHQDEPYADPVCFPLYHVSKLARDNGTIVVQVGEGSDEQFAGYRNYLRAARLAALPTIPRWLGRAAYAFLRPVLRHRRIDYRQNIIRNFLEGDRLFWGNAIAFYDPEKRLLLAPALRDEAAMHPSRELAATAAERFRSMRPGAHPLDAIIYWEIKHRLAELLLMRVDKITMAVSVEARVPFLDHALVEFSAHIPPALKTRNNTPKYILKQALRGILPDEIIDRPKIGFAGSGKNMLTPEILRHARSVLLANRHDLFDRDYLRRLLDEYERTRVNFTPQIWTLYNFELWHRWWIEGQRTL